MERDLVFCTEHSVERLSPLYLDPRALVHLQARTLPALVEVYAEPGGQARPPGEEGGRAQGATRRDTGGEETRATVIQIDVTLLAREANEDDRVDWKTQQGRLSRFFLLFNTALRLRSFRQASKPDEIFAAVTTFSLLAEALQGLQRRHQEMPLRDRQGTSWSYRLDATTDRLAQIFAASRGFAGGLESCSEGDAAPAVPPTPDMLKLVDFLRRLLVDPYKSERASRALSSPWRQYYAIYPTENVLILSPTRGRTEARSLDEEERLALRDRGLSEAAITSAASYHADSCSGALASPQCQTRILQYGPYSKVIWRLTRQHAGGGALGAPRLWETAELSFLVQRLRVRADVICIPDGTLTADDERALDRSLEAVGLFRLNNEEGRDAIAFTRASPLQTLALRTLDYLSWYLRCYLQSQTGRELIRCWREALDLYSEALLATQAYLQDATHYLLSDKTLWHRLTLFRALVAASDAIRARLQERPEEPSSSVPSFEAWMASRAATVARAAPARLGTVQQAIAEDRAREELPYVLHELPSVTNRWEQLDAGAATQAQRLIPEVAPEASISMKAAAAIARMIEHFPAPPPMPPTGRRAREGHFDEVVTRADKLNTWLASHKPPDADAEAYSTWTHLVQRLRPYTNVPLSLAEAAVKIQGAAYVERQEQSKADEQAQENIALLIQVYRKMLSDFLYANLAVDAGITSRGEASPLLCALNYVYSALEGMMAAYSQFSWFNRQLVEPPPPPASVGATLPEILPQRVDWVGVRGRQALNQVSLDRCKRWGLVAGMVYFLGNVWGKAPRVLSWGVTFEGRMLLTLEDHADIEPRIISKQFLREIWRLLRELDAFQLEILSEVTWEAFCVSRGRLRVLLRTSRLGHAEIGRERTTNVQKFQTFLNQSNQKQLQENAAAAKALVFLEPPTIAPAIRMKIEDRRGGSDWPAALIEFAALLQVWQEAGSYHQEWRNWRVLSRLDASDAPLRVRLGYLILGHFGLLTVSFLERPNLVRRFKDLRRRLVDAGLADPVSREGSVEKPRPIFISTQVGVNQHWSDRLSSPSRIKAEDWGSLLNLLRETARAQHIFVCSDSPGNITTSHRFDVLTPGTLSHVDDNKEAYRRVIETKFKLQMTHDYARWILVILFEFYMLALLLVTIGRFPAHKKTSRAHIAERVARLEGDYQRYNDEYFRQSPALLKLRPEFEASLGKTLGKLIERLPADRALLRNDTTWERLPFVQILLRSLKELGIEAAAFHELCRELVKVEPLQARTEETLVSDRVVELATPSEPNGAEVSFAQLLTRLVDFNVRFKGSASPGSLERRYVFYRTSETARGAPQPKWVVKRSSQDEDLRSYFTRIDRLQQAFIAPGLRIAPRLRIEAYAPPRGDAGPGATYLLLNLPFVAEAETLTELIQRKSERCEEADFWWDIARLCLQAEDLLRGDAAPDAAPVPVAAAASGAKFTSDLIIFTNDRPYILDVPRSEQGSRSFLRELREQLQSDYPALPPVTEQVFRQAASTENACPEEVLRFLERANVAAEGATCVVTPQALIRAGEEAEALRAPSFQAEREYPSEARYPILELNVSPPSLRVAEEYLRAEAAAAPLTPTESADSDEEPLRHQGAARSDASSRAT